MKETKIKNVKDVVEASKKIIGHIISDNVETIFNLIVDHGEGTISYCAWTPTTRIKPGPQRFLAVEDYSKTLLLLLLHPRISNLEYDEKQHMISAVFLAPELEEINHIENPGLDQY